MTVGWLFGVLSIWFNCFDICLCSYLAFYWVDPNYGDYLPIFKWFKLVHLIGYCISSNDLWLDLFPYVCIQLNRFSFTKLNCIYTENSLII